MNKQITIKDIAKELGIHHTTVSRALRDHPDVNKTTRELVLNKANEMNYVPNTFASGLRSNQSKVIGVMVPDIRPYFFSSTISHITNLAYTEGYSVMIFQSNEDVEVEKKNITALIQNRVAGLIVSLSANKKNHNLFKKMSAMNIPVVYFDRIPDSTSVDKVQINNYQAGYDSVEYLISKGCKRIAFYAGPKNLSVLTNRLKGYQKSINDNKHILKESAIYKGGLEFEDGYNTIELILKNKNIPDAIVCAVDQVAFGMIKALNNKGIRIPEQISLIGFDNDPAGKMMQPSLTTMEQPLKEVAEKTFSILLQRINASDNDYIAQHAIINMNIIKRESTN